MSGAAAGSTIAQAYAMVRAGRAEEAAALLVRAGEAGEPRALLHLAVWRLMGRPTPRDLPEARRLLARARASGDIPSAVMEVALTANGSGAPADWPAAVALLRAAAGLDPVAASHLQLLDAMAIDAVGRPTSLPAPEPLAPDGAVVRVPGFLTPGECEHLARSAIPLMQPAVVVDQRTGEETRNLIRTSDSAVLGPTRETLPIRAINARIAALSDTAIDQGEMLTVLRYAPGQEFRLHSDVLPATRNQRVKTVLLYLNDGFEGGETVFPRRGITFAPARGDALLFTNTLPNGRPDPLALHAGLPVRTGVKWLATRWIRANPFDVWIGADPDAP